MVQRPNPKAGEDDHERPGFESWHQFIVLLGKLSGCIEEAPNFNSSARTGFCSDQSARCLKRQVWPHVTCAGWF